MAMQFLVASIVSLLVWLGVPLASMNQLIFSTIVSAIIYGLSIVVAIWLPWRVKKYKTTRDDMGLTGRPSWLDVGLTPVVMIGYMLLSGIVISVLSSI